jgi:hypothetical protein
MVCCLICRDVMVVLLKVVPILLGFVVALLSVAGGLVDI